MNDPSGPLDGVPQTQGVKTHGGREEAELGGSHIPGVGLHPPEPGAPGPFPSAGEGRKKLLSYWLQGAWLCLGGRLSPPSWPSCWGRAP